MLIGKGIIVMRLLNIDFTSDGPIFIVIFLVILIVAGVVLEKISPKRKRKKAIGAGDGKEDRNIIV